MITNFREQHSVGQGFFHSGSLVPDHRYWPKVRSPLSVPALSYVYDCGSVRAHAEARAREISGFERRQQGRTIDLLFLSHLHDDHVNGVPALLKSVHVDTIAMPLLGVVERLIVFASSIAKGASKEGFHRELAIDPTTAVEQFSPRQVIFVRRSGEDGVIDDGDVPMPGVDGPLGRPESDESLTWHLLGSGSVSPGSPNDAFPAQSHAGPRTFTIDDVNFFAVSTSQNRLWILAPYVQPGAIDEGAFISKLGQLLAIGTKELVSKLNSVEFRKELVTQRAVQLREAYKSSARDLNLTTMSLFSGPSIAHLTAPACLGEAGAFTTTWGLCFAEPDSRWPAGWLGTGDADLLDGQRLDAFLRHYRHLLGRVRTLTVPHHGSKRNSGKALYDSVKPRLCVTACDSYNNWGHPAPSVIQAIASSGAASFVVTTNAVTHLTEYVHLPH